MGPRRDSLTRRNAVTSRVVETNMNEQDVTPASAEEARNHAEEQREAAELRREEAEGLRELLDRIRGEREALREASEALRAMQEQNRIAAEKVRETILNALRETADNLNATAVQMKSVEGMRQALYKLISKPSENPQ